MPSIERICRRLIPLGGRVLVEGQDLIAGTEVYVEHDSFQSVDPLDPDVFGGCGGWGMFPGHHVHTATAGDVYPSGTKLWFVLPDENRYLTVDEEFTTATARVHTFSGLVVTVKNGSTYSNQFPPEPRGLTTVAASSLNDPANVHTQPLEDLEDLLVDMINEIRGWNGVGPVTMDTGLRAVARAHAQLMNDEYCFSGLPGCTSTGWLGGGDDKHQAPGEDPPSVRVSDAGFTYGGENVYLSWGYPDPVKLAAEGWDNSCGHRATQIDPAQRLIGVGISRSLRGQYYYTYTANYAR